MATDLRAFEANLAGFQNRFDRFNPARVLMVSVLPMIIMKWPKGRSTRYARVGIGAAPYRTFRVKLRDGEMRYDPDPPLKLRYDAFRWRPGGGAVVGYGTERRLFRYFVETGFYGSFTGEGVLGYVPVRIGVGLDVSGLDR